MKKFNYLLGAAAMMVAMVFASCSNDDLPTPGIFNGDDLSTAIANHTEIVNGVPTVKLPAGVSLTLNEAIVANAPLAIIGKADDPAVIKMGKDGKFVGGVKIENVIIDATEMTSPLVTLATADAPEWTFTSVNFTNVIIGGLKKALVYSGGKNYNAALYVEDCRIQVAGNTTVFDFTKGSIPFIFNIKNSTFCAPEATSKAFFSSQAGQKASEMGEGTLLEFDFENSTFYNLAKDKNFFEQRDKGQKCLHFTIKDNIFVNCGKSGQTIKGLNGGQASANPTWAVSGNVFNFDGADTSADETTGDDDEPITNSKAVVVNFADPDNGDFSQSDVKAGDPFWYE